MSRDNFKDEFEKSKQPVEPRKTNVEHSENVEEHINDVDNNPVHNEVEEQMFPPRGVSRRNRSIERRQKGEPVEHQQDSHKDLPIENEQSESKDEARKRRERSIIASATTVGGSVVGNVKSAHAEEKEIKERKDLFDKEERERKRKEKAAAAAAAAIGTGTAGSAAHASTVKPDAKGTEKVVSSKEPVKEKPVKEKPVKSDDGGSGYKKLIPILALILILLPLLFLAGKWISNQNNEDNSNEVAMTEDKNKASDKEDKAASDKEDKAAADKEKAASDKEEKAAADKEKSTEDKATKEDSDEEVTTEAPTAEAPTTETPVAAGGTHTVGASENLYRIAIKYYGSGSPENVEKIRRANGLSGNNVSQGQTLVIPK